MHEEDERCEEAKKNQVQSKVIKARLGNIIVKTVLVIVTSIKC